MEVSPSKTPVFSPDVGDPCIYFSFDILAENQRFRVVNRFTLYAKGSECTIPHIERL